MIPHRQRVKLSDETEDTKTVEVPLTWDDVTVKHSVLTTNGLPIHLCNDGTWRTDDELRNIEIKDSE